MRTRALLLASGLGFTLLFVLVGVLSAVAAPASAVVDLQAIPAQTGNLELDVTGAISRSVLWLGEQQLDDGGFGDMGLTADVVLGLAAANLEPRLMLAESGLTPLDFMAAEALTYTASGPGEAAKLALAVAAADADPSRFAGLNLLDLLWSLYDEQSGIFAAEPFTDTNVYDQALAMLALAAVQDEVPVGAVEALLAWQGEDGGWEFSPGAGWGSDPDSTSLAVMALLASGEPVDEPLVEALNYLRATQLASGGWGWEAASPDSTGMVIQAMAAAGFGPQSWVTPDLADPLADLIALQLPEGAFPDWQGAPSVMATAHALPGLAAVPFPVIGRELLAKKALMWMVEQQQPDGGFGNASDTADTVVALAAAGYDPALVLSSRNLSPLDFLYTQVLSYSHDGGEVGKLMLAAVAAKGDPRDFEGQDLVLMLSEHLSPTGEFNTDSNFKQAIALLALQAAEEAIPAESLQWLLDQQLEDGSWEWAAGGGWGGDPDTTAIVLQTLIALGEPAEGDRIQNALAYLRGMQNPDAGFASSFDPTTNANTTAYVIQALLATGEDLLADWSVNGRTPLDALQSFAKLDGPLVYQWGGYLGPVDNAVATIQAVPALLGRPLPFKPLSTGKVSGNYAGVVVDFGDFNSAVACVPLSLEPISGVDLLEASGIPYEATEDGLVCKIGDLGCSADDCFCGGSFFWSYWYREGNDWQGYPVGAGASQVTAGTVDGWRWTEWTPEMVGPSKLLTVDALCATQTFEPVGHGADPDQLILALPGMVSLENDGDSWHLLVPAGFDANQDAVGNLLYRPADQEEWSSLALGYGGGVFTAVLPVEVDPDTYAFQIEFTDPDGVRPGWHPVLSSNNVMGSLALDYASPVTAEAAEDESPEPTPEPAVEPIVAPTEAPPEPTAVPTDPPTQEPTPAPTADTSPESESADEDAGSNAWLYGLAAALVALAAGLWWRRQSR